MDKFAQERKWYNKLHEMGNISGRAAEKFFNPEFLKVMTALRKIDNNIRSIAAGESLGTEKDSLLKEDVPGDAGSDHISLKALIKSSQSNVNRREYMQAVSDLGRFHAKLAEIVKQIDSLDANVDAVHHQFLFKHLSDGHDKETQEDVKKRLEQVQHLKNLKERMSKSSGGNVNSLVKEADIMDFFVNLTKPRGKALAAWEKRYPEKTKTLKLETDKQVAAAGKMLEIVIAELKVMASLRASRKPDDYLKEAGKIKKAYMAYDASFKEYYKTQIDGFLKKMFPTEAPAPASAGKPSVVEDAPITDKAPPSYNPGHEPTPASYIGNSSPPSSKPPSSNMPSFEPTPPSSYDSKHVNPVGPTMLSPALAPPGVTLQQAPAPYLANQPAANSNAVRQPTMLPPSGVRSRMTPAEMKSFEDAHLPDGVANHKSFYESLETMSGESPVILKAFISRYARNIQHSDPATAINLLKIATRIKG